MKLKNKISMVLIVILLLSGIVITGLWYHTSDELADVYLKDVSDSVMKDAYHAFEYLLTDTSYMATMISANTKNIIEPVENLNREQLIENNQWNQTYLNNRRTILGYINDIDGYKYYISGISIVANEKCIFTTNHTIDKKIHLYDDIQKLDKDKLKKSIVMMDPIHLEGFKSAQASDYVVPAVRGITNNKGSIVGYVIVYFDYGVIDRMFSANLPKGSFFQVVNEKGRIVYSNSNKSKEALYRLDGGYAKNEFCAENVGWTFYMAIPSQYYISGIQHTTLLTGIIIIAIIIIAVCISVFFVARMTAQITVLKNKMQEVSKGDLAVQYQIKENDEIGEMGKTFNKMVYRISELMDKIAIEEKEKRKNEMAFLQAQINPHFISNVLNNVVWMAKIQHADNLVPVVNSLNALLRAVMHQDKDLICLRDELEYVDNYLNIIEYSGSFDFLTERNIDENALALYIPRFILQPIIENVIYHGLPTNLSKQGKITIDVHVKDNLQIMIGDNGEGMSEEEIKSILNQKKKDKKSFNGIGVANVNERIKLYFGENYGLQYESKSGEYTRCIFILPIIKEEDIDGEN